MMGFLAAGLALASCASPTVPLAPSALDAAGKSFAPPPAGKATLYVAAGYIPDVATISVGQTTIGSLTERTWLRADLEPGSYDVHVRSPYSTSSLSLTLAPGSITYTQLRYVDLRPWTDRLSVTSESTGRALLLAGRRVAEARQATGGRADIPARQGWIGFVPGDHGRDLDGFCSSPS